MILPIKGNDIKQRENFESLKNQRYRNYRILAVADSHTDSAVNVAKSVGIDVAIARGPWKRSSGKSRAIAYALSKFKNYDIFVIADSDIKVKNDWLAKPFFHHS
ncbi:MAG: glycosyltransferase [Candidatus Micrarchaeia archaeon]